MKKLSKLIEFVDTKEFILLSLIFSLVPQLFHSVMAFVGLSTYTDSLSIQILVVMSGVFFALGVSLSILVQTLRGNQKMAYVYLFIELLINLVYYETYSKESWVLIVIQGLFALIMPITIASYSNLMGEVRNTIDKDELQEKLDKQYDKVITAANGEAMRLKEQLRHEIENRASIDTVKEYLNKVSFYAENQDNGKSATIKIKPNEEAD